MDSSLGEITALLVNLRRGNQDAEAKLIPLVYRQLHRPAAHYMRLGAAQPHLAGNGVGERSLLAAGGRAREELAGSGSFLRFRGPVDAPNPILARAVWSSFAFSAGYPLNRRLKSFARPREP